MQFSSSLNWISQLKLEKVQTHFQKIIKSKNMNHCEPSFLKHYFFMSLIIGFWPTNWKDMGILKRYHNITLVCLWEWYKIEKYGIILTNFFSNK